MKGWAFLLLAILPLAFANLSFAQTPERNNQPEPEATLSDAASSPGLDSGEAVTKENNEVEPPSSAEEAFRRAVDHAGSNELEEAIADCTKAIRLDPGTTKYLIGRAELYYETRKFDKGFEDADKILEANPNDLPARLLRGKMLEVSGDPDKALIEFNTAVERNPTSVQALLERHSYFQRQGQSDKAMADADRITQLQPQSPAGYLARARTAAASGDVEQVMNYASLAVQQNPKSWEAYMTRATTRVVNDDFVGASEDFEAALRLSPDNALVINTRGIFYLQTGDYEKSLADMERAVELQPQTYAFKAALADLLSTCPDERIRSGKNASAYAAEALRLAPNDPLVWNVYAAAAAESGNFEEAIKWEQRVLDSGAVPLVQKGLSQERLEAYKAKRSYRDNAAVLRQALAKLKEANDAINNGHFDRAIALLSEVIDADPKVFSDASTLRGIAYHRLKKYDLSIADLSAAIENDPHDATAHFFRARSFYKIQNYARAIDDYKILDALPPDGSHDPLNNLAWLFATCPDDEVRDGSKAADYIDRALERRPNDLELWDTCAAVLAENGDFDGAIERENACIDSREIPEEQRRDCEKRLTLYKQHRPYRDEPESTATQLAASATELGK